MVESAAAAGRRSELDAHVAALGREVDRLVDELRGLSPAEQPSRN
jgi:hypothetical protein